MSTRPPIPMTRGLSKFDVPEKKSIIRYPECFSPSLERASMNDQLKDQYECFPQLERSIYHGEDNRQLCTVTLWQRIKDTSKTRYSPLVLVSVLHVN